MIDDIGSIQSTENSGTGSRSVSPSEESSRAPSSPPLRSDSSLSFNLGYQPAMIKGRGGERLWKVDCTSRRCVDFCKLQLQV